MLHRQWPDGLMQSEHVSKRKLGWDSFIVRPRSCFLCAKSREVQKNEKIWKNEFDQLHFSTYRKSKLFEGKPLSTRPPSVRGPKDCRLKSSSACSLFPVAEITFPLAETDFPLGKFGFPLAEIKFPLAEITFPLVETNFPLGEFRFPLAENKFPSSELTKLFAEIKFCDHSKFGFEQKTRTKNMQWVKWKITIFAQ